MHLLRAACPRRTAHEDPGTTMPATTDGAALARALAAAAEAREVRRQLARDREALRAQYAARMARSSEQLRLTGDLLVVLAREGAEGGRYRT